MKKIILPIVMSMMLFGMMAFPAFAAEQAPSASEPQANVEAIEAPAADEIADEGAEAPEAVLAEVQDEAAEPEAEEAAAVLTAAPATDWHGNAIDPTIEYRIVSAVDADIVLDAAGKSPKAGANVCIWTNNGGANQRFFLTADSDDFYTVHSAIDSTLVLDANGTTPKAGSNVSLWTGSDSDNQKWSLVDAGMVDGNQAYFFRCSFDEELSLDANGTAPKAGSNVSIWTASEDANQMWLIVPANDLAYANVEMTDAIRNYTGSALAPAITVTMNGEELTEGIDYDVTYDGASSATAVNAYAVHIVPASTEFIGEASVGTFTICETPEAYGGSAVSDGATFRIVNAAVSGAPEDTFVMDAAGKAPEAGANIALWSNNGGANQMFSFELDSDGYYTIKSAIDSNLVLDANGVSPKEGSNVSLWDLKGDLNQKWVLVRRGAADNGAPLYAFVSAYNTDLVLDANGTTIKKGANVSLWTDKDGANQQWYLIPGNDLLYAQTEATELIHNTTGSTLTANVTVSMNGTELEQGTDYEVLYSGGTAPTSEGEYSLMIEAKGSTYTGTKELGTFYVVADPGIESGPMFALQSVADSSLVLDINGHVPSAGSTASAWTGNGGANQTFTFEFDSEKGYYTVRSVAVESLVLDAAAQKGMPESGAKIVLWTDNGGLNQRWVLKASDMDAADELVFVNASNPDLVLDIAGETPKEGSKATLWTENGGANQSWELAETTATDISSWEIVPTDHYYTGSAIEPADLTLKDPEGNIHYLYKNVDYTAAYTDNSYLGEAGVTITARGVYEGTVSGFFRIILKDGTYYISLKNNSNMVLDIANANKNNGGNLVLWNKNSEPNQGFTIKYEGDGYYSIKNFNSNRYLDVAYAGTNVGSNILQYQWKGGDNQYWEFDQDANGAYLINKNSDLYAGTSSTPKAGSNVDSRDYADALKLKFTEVPKADITRWTKSPIEIAMTEKAQNYWSATNWLIMIDDENCRFGVYYWTGSEWECKYFWLCTTGKESTPTIHGQFTAGSKGYSFGSSEYTCYYYTQIYGNYLIHSIKYKPGHYPETVDGRLGIHASQGCVRLAIENAEWVYDYIPYGTKIVIY